MVQKYQNEIPPIFYYGISTKTNEKDLKIPNLQALTLGRIIKITLYYASQRVISAQIQTVILQAILRSMKLYCDDFSLHVED